MRKILSLTISAALVLALTACGSSSQPGTSSSLPQNPQEPVVQEPVTQAPDTQEPDETPIESGNKVLVAYFSRAENIEFDPSVDATTSSSINLSGDAADGNAKLLAEMAQTATGGDLFSIQTVNKYPTAYRATTDQAKTEQYDNARPELSTHVEDMDTYDTIVLIYPNWWGGLPMPVYTFLGEYDFDGKTILPLCTHGGSGLSQTEREIADACPGAMVLEGLAVRGSNAASAETDVVDWINVSGILDE